MLYRVRGANSCALHCGKGRPRSFVGWGTAPAFYRGGGGFGTLPRGRSRHTYVTLRGGNPILYRVERGCVGHMCVVCGEPDRARYCFLWGVGFIHGTVHGARCVTVWDEPTHTRYVVRGGPGSCTCVQYAQFDVYYDNAIVMSARAGA